MKNLIIVTTVLFSLSSFAQDKFYTRSGHINFYSHAPLEDITAENNQVAAFLATATGKLTFAVLMKSFEFNKALMEEHFNENYVESDEYPRAKFSGTIQNYSAINVFKNGTYNVSVKGELSLHGVTNEIVVPAILNVEKDKIKATSKFSVKPIDYKIKIPSAVKNNIAENIEINVDVELVPYKK